MTRFKNRVNLACARKVSRFLLYSMRRFYNINRFIVEFTNLFCWIIKNY